MKSVSWVQYYLSRNPPSSLEISENEYNDISSKSDSGCCLVKGAPFAYPSRQTVPIAQALCQASG